MSFFDQYKEGRPVLKIYTDMPVEHLRLLQHLNADVIPFKSGDFLGIRECKIALIQWSNQLEIGAALALRKHVLTVTNRTNLDNPNILAFDNWPHAVQYIPILLKQI